jgi:SAM-dependent methyltransferase
MRPNAPRPDVLPEYLAATPAALAIERSVEVRHYAGVPMPRPVLDIGCGDGLFAAMAFPGGIETGIDPDPRELECASRVRAYGELLQCSGDAVPRPDGSFNTVVANSVLEHIPDVGAVMREAHRLLAPGGRMYATVPTDRFERYSAMSQLLVALRLTRLADRWHRFYNRFWRHHHAYPVDGWKRLAEDAGFAVAGAKTYGPRRMCLLDDLLAPLGLPAKIRKDRTGRWVPDSALRRALVRLAVPALDRLLRGADRAPEGGLVFLTLVRR